jgi:hypothetical protein
MKLWLNEFYIHQFQENVTEPTDKADEGDEENLIALLVCIKYPLTSLLKGYS